MTPEPQNGFGVSFLHYFFLGSKRGVLAGGFAFSVGAERGFLMVICGAFVAKTWLQNGNKLTAKNTPAFGDLFFRMGSADCGHGGAEEGLKVLGGFGVFCDGGFDGLLGNGTSVAKVDQGGEGVVTGGTVVRASGSGGDGDGEVIEFVFEFENDAFGGLLADARDAGEGGVVARANGGDEAIGTDAAQDSDRKLGADAGDGEEFFEEALFLGLREAEEGKLVFADMCVDVEGDCAAFVRKGRVGGYADGYVVTYSGAFDDGLARGFGEKASAKMGDHASGIVAWLIFGSQDGFGCLAMTRRTFAILTNPE